MPEENPQSSPPPRQVIANAAAETGTATAAALIGLALGGPVGAVAGAAIGPATNVMTSIVRRTIELRRERAARVLEAAASSVEGGLESLEEALLSDDKRLQIAVAALEEAMRSSLTEKVETLSGIISAAAEASVDQLDGYLLLAKAISQLDAPHLMMLSVIAGTAPDRGNSWTPVQLEARLGEPAEVLRPLVRQLELHGLITDIGWKRPSSTVVQWTITPIGTSLLGLMQSRRRHGDNQE